MTGIDMTQEQIKVHHSCFATVGILILRYEILGYSSHWREGIVTVKQKICFLQYKGLRGSHLQSTTMHDLETR